MSITGEICPVTDVARSCDSPRSGAARCGTVRSVSPNLGRWTYPTDALGDNWISVATRCGEKNFSNEFGQEHGYA